MSQHNGMNFVVLAKMVLGQNKGFIRICMYLVSNNLKSNFQNHYQCISLTGQKIQVF